VTLSPAVRIYEELQAHAQSQGLAKPTDYLFLPQESDREHALALFNFWLKWVLRSAELPLTDAHGQSRTLYALRHTSLTFRLLYGQGIDMLTLARNARTSVDMIERFYASTLTGEMNVGLLQSRRGAKKPRGFRPGVESTFESGGDKPTVYGKIQGITRILLRIPDNSAGKNKPARKTCHGMHSELDRREWCALGYGLCGRDR